MPTQLSSVSDALTARALGCAAVLGTAVCLTNMYFGLQAGSVNAMPMQSALLAFAIFRSVQHRLSKPLSPPELTLIEITAGALGLAPFTSGFTSFIPALEFLATAEETNGPVRFGFARLLLWSVATCGLGIVVAAPARHLFILRERLRYPSATATGTLIGVLFGNKTIVSRASQPAVREVRSRLVQLDNERASQPAEDEASHDQVEDDGHDQGLDRTLPGSQVQESHGTAIKVLVVSLAGSAAFSLTAYFLPVLRQVPIFGLIASRRWLWSFDLSPAYFGYGIIIGPRINAFTLLGAIIGWGILSPVAKTNGWAPGPIGDWDTGSRGWILWVGMGLILGDSTIGVGWLVLKPVLLWSRRKFEAWRSQGGSQPQEPGERAPLLGGETDDSAENRCSQTRRDWAEDDEWPGTALATTALTLWTGIVLVIIYCAVVLWAFDDFVPVLATVLALVLIPLVAFISMRSLGETDNGAALAIGRVAQFVIGALVPASSTKYTSANLLLSGAVESGASQASQHMGGLKTAYMTQTAPRAVFYGQMVGSFVGTIVSTLLYKLYTAVKTLPSDEFGLPDAHLYLVVSRLLRNQGAPPKVVGFWVGAFVLGAAFGALRVLGSKSWWRSFVPSGVAMAIGMYVVPAITLPRALGSLILVIGRDKFGLEYIILLCSATGLIFGQALVTPLTLMLDAFHVPKAA